MLHTTEIPGGLKVALARDFGAVERWHAQFVELARTMHGRPGRAVLLWSHGQARLVNRWIEAATELAGGDTPLFETESLEPSINDLDWTALNQRYVAAVAAHTRDFGLSADELRARRAEFDVLDVRRDAPFDAAADMIEGASRADPEQVAEWASRLRSSRKVAVYCVYGHEVGQSTAALLRKRGIDALWLEGGIEQWKQEGRPLQPKGATA